MDDLIAQIIARLERNAQDHSAIAVAHGRVAGTFDRGQAAGFGSASRLVRQMWDSEQARIADEERGSPSYATDMTYLDRPVRDSDIDTLSANGAQE